MTTKSLKTASVATLTTGIVMVEHFEGVGEAAEAIVGHPIWTHELPDARPRIIELVVAQYPDFPIEPPEDWAAARDAVIAQYGETMEFECGTDERTASPIKTLATMMGDRQ